MGDLADLQRTFYDRVVAGRDADPIIATGDLGIYARMYASRLHATLADDYPKLRAALGEAAFAAVLTRFLAVHPPTSFTLRDAGLHLPAHLRGAAPAWQADLAALERARVEVFDGLDAAPLTQADVMALGDALPALVLRLVPASRVVALASTADDVWSALEDADAPPAATPATRAVLVWRRAVSVIHRTLDADEAALAPRLVEGIPFADLCEQLAGPHGEGAAGRATELLLRWLEAEVLCATTGPTTR